MPVRKQLLKPNRIEEKVNSVERRIGKKLKK